MYIPSYNEIKEIDDSKYKLALMVAKRARQLNNGAESYIEDEDSNKVTTAMKEIVEGHIVGKN
ncbi:DNA-directed RNA polymerase subunit omega [Neofamilia massiliensis]|uniref:DNA-directed RNA polymerase subunit omega n=1 Tax=Neofamilia massiliensis TaxID=1673724 RepID=UPI0006BB9018|nr:DNA-directed RNA polymerase subunit omega [Neofamilia massiliensis]